MSRDWKEQPSATMWAVCHEEWCNYLCNESRKQQPLRAAALCVQEDPLFDSTHIKIKKINRTPHTIISTNHRKTDVEPPPETS